MKRVVAFLLSALVSPWFISPAFGIVIRHDVADARYLELAAEVPRPVILLTNRLGSADGMGVWIAPNWILTAAHVAEMIAPGDTVGTTDKHQVAEVVLYPDWQRVPVDVALLRVSQMPENVRPVDVCPVTNPEGETVTFAGAGDTGNGETGPAFADGKMRAARNVINSANEHFVTFVFDAPDSEDTVPLEGISGPGDSGGPAYLSTDAGFCVLAVSSGQDAKPAGGLNGRYGVVEFYSRVDVLRDWIDKTIGPSVGQ